MDNKINDKDLELVNGGSAVTPQLAKALDQLRIAENFFTDDIPELPKRRISGAIGAIENGEDDTGILKRDIQTAISELNTFMSTLAESDSNFRKAHEIIFYLESAVYSMG